MEEGGRYYVGHNVKETNKYREKCWKRAYTNLCIWVGNTSTDIETRGEAIDSITLPLI